MQKPIILPYVPRAQFEPFHARWQRWVCMITHRRCGKTYAVLMEMLHKAMLKKDGRYAYIAPLRNQAKVVAWEMLKSFARPISGTSLRRSFEKLNPRMSWNRPE